MAHSSARTLAGAVFLFVLFFAGPARADLVTVDWDVTPHDNTFVNYGDSPYYECYGSLFGSRLCDWLWQNGLRLDGSSSPSYDFYDDKFLDGYGRGESESVIWADEAVAAMLIRPECKSGLGPCFDLFTPSQMRIRGLSNNGPLPNLFVISSAGGLLKFPSINDLTIDFGGNEWRNLSWLGYGFYLPAECDADDPPSDLGCDTGTEKALEITDLTFEPVPEPAVMWLLAAGVLSVAVRRRRA